MRLYLNLINYIIGNRSDVYSALNAHNNISLTFIRKYTHVDNQSRIKPNIIGIPERNLYLLFFLYNALRYMSIYCNNIIV